MAANKEIEEDQESLTKIKAEIFKRFDSANEKVMNIIQDYLQTGYLETFCNLLYFLPEDRRASVLESFPPEIKSEVQSRLQKNPEKSRENTEVLSSVGKIMRKADFYGEKVSNEILEGKNAFFTLLSEKETADLYSKNPYLAANIDFYSISIEVIMYLDDRSVQKLLREVDSTVLAKALKNCSVDVKTKIFNNMSKRAAILLQEDIEFMGPVDMLEVINAQDTIIRKLIKLKNKGEIILANLSLSPLSM